ncbi:hypothetical protein MKX03_013427 [Papaver bracteatum]|nr:hypothetical protein MKX03_013427 [Papaver bracteatum]
MDSPTKSIADELLDVVKSWMPRKTKAANVSRDFWMPDHSCRVCYECDAQFSTFNRRHHCRLCGRVFCAKCTSKSIPALSDEESSTTGGEEECVERIRVCDYCYKQWEDEMKDVSDGVEVMSPGGISPTHSTIHESSQELEGVNKPGQTLNDNIDGGKGEMSSSSSFKEGKMVEPVDFENNGILWIPPGPEDVEDDEEAVLLDDGEDDATGEWRHLRPSTSFGDGEPVNAKPSASDGSLVAVVDHPSANNVGALASTGRGELSSSDLTTLEQDRKNSSKEQGSSKEDFPQCTTDDQSILVSLSTRCVWKGTSFRCRFCEMPSEAHIHSYTHRQGTLTISVKKLEILLPGEGEGKIWMWHRCLQCPRVNGLPPPTLRVVMSDAAWGLSFGKSLELSFSNHAAADCGHSLHRDCLRFYGSGRMVACFRYASTNVHSVYLPLSKLDFFFFLGKDNILKNTQAVVNRAGYLFGEVSNALRKIADQRTGSRGLTTELEGLLKTEKAEYEESLQNALNREEKKGQPVIDIIEINGLRRQLIFNIYLLDQRLVYAASTDNKPFKEKLNTSAPKQLDKSVSTETNLTIMQDENSQIDVKSNGSSNQEGEQHNNDLNTTLRSLESQSWVRVPFLELYKNSPGRAPKLDNLGQYNPVYLPVVRELPHLGGARFFLPTGVDGTVVPVYDDEPTSVISYALASPEYHSQISGERLKDGGGSSASKSLHASVSFTDDSPPLGKVKYTVTCYYSSRFEALRRMCCPSELDFVRSLSRCEKWDKSNVFFAKSLDDRFIIKQVTKTELESFLQFAPEYFKYLTESIDTRSQTCLVKILGIYQVTSKHQNGGKDVRIDVLVMENLLYGRNVTRLYDLKGSTQSRYNADASGSNKVLLDQNLIEAMPTSPIFVGNKAKRLLERAVWNDTSLLAAKQELVVGIINFMRQYTWDKHLETWVKTLDMLGGAKNSTPTVISPKQYKKRFRKAMSEYFLMVPDEWSPQNIIPSASQSDLDEDNTV